MKVLHVLLEQASHFDHTCFEADSAPAEAASHEAIRLGPTFSMGTRVSADSSSLVHIHGLGAPPRKLLAGLPVPWISDRRLKLPHTLIRSLAPPAGVVLESNVPDCARPEYFVERELRQPNTPRRVGTWVRNGRVRNNVEQALARLLRFREDIDWTMFTEPPAPQDLSSLDLWVDPASEENDLDGLVCEAIACGLPVVASRIPANDRRLDRGRVGFLTPPGDHNELVHAVLNALFKEETLRPILDQARLVRDYLRPESRRERLVDLYSEIVG